MALSHAFNPTAFIRRGLIATAAAAALMGGPVYAQDTTTAVEPAPTTDTATTAAAPTSAQRAAKPSRRTRSTTTTTFNQDTCMEITQTSSRNGGFLGILGVVRNNKTTSVYNEACGDNRINENVAINMMTATKSDGTPDMPLRALGIQMYLEQSPEGRAKLDRILDAHGTSFTEVNFTISNSAGAVQCVRQAVAVSPLTGTASTNVTFRCLPRVAQ